MQDRKTAFTGGRMLRTIDGWIQTKLDALNGAVNPGEDSRGRIMSEQQFRAKQYAENQPGPYSEDLEAGTLERKRRLPSWPGAAIPTVTNFRNSAAVSPMSRTLTFEALPATAISGAMSSPFTRAMSSRTPQMCRVQQVRALDQNTHESSISGDLCLHHPVQ